MKNKIYYICALGHSGSTWLQLKIAEKFKAVSLGEFHQLIKEVKINGTKNIPLCSCGSSIFECLFWSNFLDIFESYSSHDISDNILDYISANYSDHLVIDNSKSLSAYKDLYSIDSRKEICFLFLIRDVRGWVLSSQNRSKRKNRKVHSSLYEYYRWFYVNLKIFYHLKRNNLDFHVLLYDKLVFDISLLDHIFTNPVQNIRHNPNEYVHDFFGNRMKSTYSKNENKLVYSYDWFFNLRSYLLFPLIFPVILFNSFLYKLSNRR